jgi:prepilin signal peptidase PulO-like enzyme (type II secretory pathway)
MVKYVVWTFVVGGLLLFFLVPLATHFLLQSGFDFQSMSLWLDATQFCQTIAMHAFVYLWITFLGSCFASFLNVVAWRVPRGRSILGSSHCPHCDRQLALKDNVPIFGWLNNDGKCRNCRAPIAVRYLIVELLLGVIFLLLFLAEVILGGVNLPVRPELNRVGVEFVLFTPNWFLILTFVYHATLICGLFTVATIGSEGRRVPKRVLFFAAIFLIAIASTWADVIQVPWTAGVMVVGDWPPDQFSQTSLMTITFGSVVGSFFGVVLQWLTVAGGNREQNRTQLDHSFSISPHLAEQSRGTSSAFASLLLVGLGLGWQSVLWVSVIAIAVQWSLQRLAWPASLTIQKIVTGNPSAVVMFATIMHLLFWRWQMPVQFWLSTLNGG